MLNFACVESQDKLKLDVKLWLKANNYSYAWLAERCYVTEATVRNWMARKSIPEAKAHIIRELIKQVPLTLPGRVRVQEETRVTIEMDQETRRLLEKRAFAQGKTLPSSLLTRLLTSVQSKLSVVLVRQVAL